VSTDQERSPRHALKTTRLVDGRVILRKALIDVTRPSVLTDDDPRVLNGAVGEEELAAHEPGQWMGSCVRNQRVEPTGLRQRIVVQKDKKRSLGPAGTMVARRRIALIGLVADDPNSFPIRGQDLRCGVAGTIVDDDNLHGS